MIEIKLSEKEADLVLDALDSVIKEAQQQDDERNLKISSKVQRKITEERD